MCRGFTKRGLPCLGFAMRGDFFCYAHQPERADPFAHAPDPELIWVDPFAPADCKGDHWWRHNLDASPGWLADGMWVGCQRCARCGEERLVVADRAWQEP